MNSKEGELVLLKKYVVMEKIGSGSFGEIYLCTRIFTQANTCRKNANMLSSW